jgi:hypothetical protein
MDKQHSGTSVWYNTTQEAQAKKDELAGKTFYRRIESMITPRDIAASMIGTYSSIPSETLDHMRRDAVRIARV